MDTRSYDASPMFTGIVETTARVLAHKRGSMVIMRPSNFDDVNIGSSISVSGVCLSIVELTKDSMMFNVISETYAKTKIGALNSGDVVNLERAMKSDARLDGHIVQGHVEAVAQVVSSPSGAEREITKKKPLLPKIKYFSRLMRKQPTDAESVLWQALRHDQLGVRVRRQYPMGGRILDFYIPSEKLAIEVDGSVHHKETVRSEDAVRDRYLQEEHGIRILRFSNDHVCLRLPMVLTEIQAAIHSHPSSSGGGAGGGGMTRSDAVLLLRIPEELLPSIQKKGSIAIDGVSLTVAKKEGNLVTVALIPHTIEHTTLGSLKEGDQVNIETDVMTRR